MSRDRRKGFESRSRAQNIRDISDLYEPNFRQAYNEAVSQGFNADCVVVMRHLGSGVAKSDRPGVQVYNDYCGSTPVSIEVVPLDRNIEMLISDTVERMGPRPPDNFVVVLIYNERSKRGHASKPAMESRWEVDFFPLDAPPDGHTERLCIPGR